MPASFQSVLVATFAPAAATEHHDTWINVIGRQAEQRNPIGWQQQQQ
jgi:hypothetical protein